MITIFRRRMRQQMQDAARALTLSTTDLPSTEQAVPISRRLLLAGGGSLVSTAAMAMPVGSALAEDPATRVARLAEELSVALDSYVGGSFRAIIEPDSRSTCPVLFQNRRRLDARDRLNRSIGAARDALAEIYGCDPADHSFIGEVKGVVVIAAMPAPTERVVWDFEAVA